jgi:hypothetical protein
MMDFWINGMMGRKDRWLGKLSGLNVLRCVQWNASRNQNCLVNLLRPPAKMLRPVLRPFAQKTSVNQCLLRRYDLPGGSSHSCISAALKHQVPSSNLAGQSPVLTGLSVDQRRPNGYYHVPITCGNSTHLHPTHTHLRYNTAYRDESVPSKTAKNGPSIFWEHCPSIGEQIV